MASVVSHCLDGINIQRWQHLPCKAHLHTTVQLKHQVFIPKPLESDQIWPSCLHRYVTARGLNPHMHRLHANLTLCHSFVGFQGVSQHIPHCNLSLKKIKKESKNSNLDLGMVAT